MPRGGRIKGTKNIRDLYRAYQAQYEKAITGRYGGEGAFSEMLGAEEFKAIMNRMKQLRQTSQEYVGYSNVSLVKSLVSSQRQQSFKFRQKAPKEYARIYRERTGVSKKEAQQAAKLLFTKEGAPLRKGIFWQFVSERIIQQNKSFAQAKKEFLKFYY